jgi:hypothetical protein
MEDKYFGTGMKFPPQINPTTGRFTTVTGRESIRESIYLILMTQRGERQMRPSYGSNLMRYTFATMNISMQTMMASEISSDILRCEPRVSDVRVNLDTESKPGCVFINIDYTIASDNTEDNMVFPFYLNGKPEKESGAYETMDFDNDEQV